MHECIHWNSFFLLFDAKIAICIHENSKICREKKMKRNNQKCEQQLLNRNRSEFKSIIFNTKHHANHFKYRNFSSKIKWVALRIKQNYMDLSNWESLFKNHARRTLREIAKKHIQQKDQNRYTYTVVAAFFMTTVFFFIIKLIQLGRHYIEQVNGYFSMIKNEAPFIHFFIFFCWEVHRTLIH